MANPNLVALSAYAGKYQKQLLGKLYHELKLQADGIQVLPGITSKMKLPRLAIGRGLKPYTGKFVSMDDQIKYSDREISVERVQRDLEIEPEKYRGSYLEANDNKAIASNANKMAQVPYAQFMWQEFMRENAEEVVLALYHAVGKAAFAAYNGATAYAVDDLMKFTNTAKENEVQYYKCITATNAAESPLTHPEKWEWVGHLAMFEGFGKKIQDAIDNEGFDAIAATGVLTAMDIYNQMTMVYRLQSEKVKGKGNLLMYCSENNKELLLDAIEEKRKNFEAIDSILHLPKTDKKCIIKSVPWLAGSNRLICTPTNNFSLGTNQLSDLNALTNIEQHYTLETSLSFVMGVQFADLDVMTINDQE